MNYPFGSPVSQRPASSDSRCTFFVLGAYPSALYIKWTPPRPYKPIAALAVDNEPTPFWDGSDEYLRFRNWMSSISWNTSWGLARPAGDLNGSSGRWLNRNLFLPMRWDKSDICISDSLDIYHLSKGAEGRISDTYNPFAKAHGLPEANVLPHPIENQIVEEATLTQLDRIRNELLACRPEFIVTLGNAALRIMNALVEPLAGLSGIPRQLSSRIEEYGKPYPVNIPGSRQAGLFPLAHPAAPEPYQTTHAAWLALERRSVFQSSDAT